METWIPPTLGILSILAFAQLCFSIASNRWDWWNARKGK